MCPAQLFGRRPPPQHPRRRISWRSRLRCRGLHPSRWPSGRPADPRSREGRPRCLSWSEILEACSTDHWIQPVRSVSMRRGLLLAEAAGHVARSQSRRRAGGAAGAVLDLQRCTAVLRSGWALASATRCSELEFTTENTAGVQQQVLPTYGVLLAQARMAGKLGDFDRAMLVHAEQSVELHRPLPVAGTLRTVCDGDRHLRQGLGRTGGVGEPRGRCRRPASRLSPRGPARSSAVRAASAGTAAQRAVAAARPGARPQGGPADQA